MQALSKLCLTPAVFAVILALYLVGCNPPGRNTNIPQVKLSLKNTLPVKRNSVPIALSLSELRQIAPDFSFDAYLVVSGDPPREIASQAEDTNDDGQKDLLFFVVDLAAQETKEVSVRYSPDNQMAVTLGFTRRVRAGVFPALASVAALESREVAYLLKPSGDILPYGKSLERLFSAESVFQGDLDFNTTPPPNWRQVFESNKISLSPNTTIEIVEREKQWKLWDGENKRQFFIKKAEKDLEVFGEQPLLLNRFAAEPSDELMTRLAPTDTIGSGGFRIWDTLKNEPVSIGNVRDYVQIIADGPVRAVVRRAIPDIPLPSEEGNCSLFSKITVSAESPWAEHQLQVKGLNERYGIFIGLPGGDFDVDRNDRDGLLWSWSAEKGIGFGIIYPAARWVNSQDIGNAGQGVLLKPDENGMVSYHFCALWREAQLEIDTEAAFERYVEVTAKALRTPPAITMLSKPATAETKE